MPRFHGIDTGRRRHGGGGSGHHGGSNGVSGNRHGLDESLGFDDDDDFDNTNDKKKKNDERNTAAAAASSALQLPSCSSLQLSDNDDDDGKKEEGNNRDTNSTTELKSPRFVSPQNISKEAQFSPSPAAAPSTTNCTTDSTTATQLNSGAKNSPLPNKAAPTTAASSLSVTPDVTNKTRTGEEKITNVKSSFKSRRRRKKIPSATTKTTPPAPPKPPPPPSQVAGEHGVTDSLALLGLNANNKEKGEKEKKECEFNDKKQNKAVGEITKDNENVHKGTPRSMLEEEENKGEQKEEEKEAGEDEKVENKNVQSPPEEKKKQINEIEKETVMEENKNEDKSPSATAAQVPPPTTTPPPPQTFDAHSIIAQAMTQYISPKKGSTSATITEKPKKQSGPAPPAKKSLEMQYQFIYDTPSKSTSSNVKEGRMSLNSERHSLNSAATSKIDGRMSINSEQHSLAGVAASKTNFENGEQQQQLQRVSLNSTATINSTSKKRVIMEHDTPSPSSRKRPRTIAATPSTQQTSVQTLQASPANQTPPTNAPTLMEEEEEISCTNYQTKQSWLQAQEVGTTTASSPTSPAKFIKKRLPIPLQLTTDNIYTYPSSSSAGCTSDNSLDNPSDTHTATATLNKSQTKVLLTIHSTPNNSNNKNVLLSIPPFTPTPPKKKLGKKETTIQIYNNPSCSTLLWEAIILQKFRNRHYRLYPSKSLQHVPVPIQFIYSQRKNKLTKIFSSSLGLEVKLEDKEVVLGTLSDLLQLHLCYNTGPIPEYIVVCIIKQVLEIVMDMHKCGIVHNDLSLRSFLVVKQKDRKEWFVKIVGFGLHGCILDCQGDADDAMTRTAQTNKEKNAKKEECNEWHYEHDLYSLANIVHLLLTGGQELSWQQQNRQTGKTMLSWKSQGSILGNKYLRGSLAWEALLDALLNGPGSSFGLHCLSCDGDDENEKEEKDGKAIKDKKRAFSTFQVWEELSHACKLLRILASTDGLSKNNNVVAHEDGDETKRDSPFTSFLDDLLEHRKFSSHETQNDGTGKKSSSSSELVSVGYDLSTVLKSTPHSRGKSNLRQIEEDEAESPEELSLNQSQQSKGSANTDTFFDMYFSKREKNLSIREKELNRRSLEAEQDWQKHRSEQEQLLAKNVQESQYLRKEMKQQEERHQQKIEKLSSDWSTRFGELRQNLDLSEREIGRLNGLLEDQQRNEEMEEQYHKLEEDLKDKETAFKRKEYLLTDRIMELTQDIQEKSRALELWSRTQSEFETVKRVLSQKNVELNEKEALIARRQSQLDERYTKMKQNIEKHEESVRKKEMELQERIHEKEEEFMQRHEAMERKSRELEEQMKNLSGVGHEKAMFHRMEKRLKDELRQREEAVALREQEASAREQMLIENFQRMNVDYASIAQQSSSSSSASRARGAKLNNSQISARGTVAKQGTKKGQQSNQTAYSYARDSIGSSQPLTQPQPLTNTNPYYEGRPLRGRASSLSPSKEAGGPKKQSKPSRSKTPRKRAEKSKANATERKSAAAAAASKTSATTRTVCSLQGQSSPGMYGAASPSSTKKAPKARRKQTVHSHESRNEAGKIVVCIDESSESETDR